MAKAEGTQTIPSEWNNEYLGTLTRKLESDVVRKRYPFRIKLRQEGGYKVSEKQKAQRQRFKDGRDSFKNTGSAERTRWYNAMPAWNSVLWYYNYFIMSAISGVAGSISQISIAVKSIQRKADTIGTAGNWITFDTEVDPKKAAIFLFGAAHSEILVPHTGLEYAFAFNIFPIFESMNSKSIFINWSEVPTSSKIVNLQIIEYV